MIYDDAQDALAAEYVLGTLSGDEREHAEALLEIDPGFAESVRLWERRLGELNVMVEAVEPPPAVWEKISKEIGYVAPASTSSIAPAETAAAIPPADASAVPDGRNADARFGGGGEARADGGDATRRAAYRMLFQTPLRLRWPSRLPSRRSRLQRLRRADPLAEEARRRCEPREQLRSKLGRGSERRAAAPMSVQLSSRRVKQWRSTAIAMQAIAALLAIYVVAAQFYPDLIPLRGRATETQTAQAPAQLAARLVAVLQQEPNAPAFLLSVDPQSRTLVVRRVSATPEQGRSYELWLIAKGAPTPKSLGLVGSDEFTQRTIPGNLDLATLRSASYAVSLEPAGGSPSGVPTGPVLFTGNIVESRPDSTAHLSSLYAPSSLSEHAGSLSKTRVPGARPGT